MAGDKGPDLKGVNAVVAKEGKYEQTGNSIVDDVTGIFDSNDHPLLPSVFAAAIGGLVGISHGGLLSGAVASAEGAWAAKSLRDEGLSNNQAMIGGALIGGLGGLSPLMGGLASMFAPQLANMVANFAQWSGIGNWFSKPSSSPQMVPTY